MIYVKDSIYTDKRPVLNNVVSADDNLLRQAGWGLYDEADLPEDRRHWVIDGNTITELSQEGKDAIAAQDLAEAEAQAQAAADAQAAALAGLVSKIGGMVMALQSNLAAFGLSLPTTKAEVMGTIMAASLAGRLTDEQKEAKSDAGLLYILMGGEGVNDDQINAVWQYLEAQE